MYQASDSDQGQDEYPLSLSYVVLGTRTGTSPKEGKKDIGIIIYDYGRKKPLELDTKPMPADGHRLFSEL